MALEERNHARMVVVADIIAIALALGIGVALHVGYEGPDSARPQTFMIISLLVFWPIMLWQLQTRATTILGGGAEEYRRVLMASLWTVALTMSLAYITSTMQGRRFLFYSAVTGTIFLLIDRGIMRHLLHRRLQRGGALHRVFVVAAEAQYPQLEKQFARSGGLMEQVGNWDLTDAADPDPTVVVKAAVELDADTIVYAPAQHEDPTWPRRLGWAMEEHDLSLLVSPQIANIAGPRLSIEPVNGMALVRVEMPRFSGPAKVVKRAIDVVGSSVLLVLLAVPLAFFALLIKLTSPGPVFFMQTRAGAGGTTFDCFKFRTMVVDADAQRDRLRAEHGDEQAATFKMSRDPRVTSVGHWLRRFSLDELPRSSTSGLDRWSDRSATAPARRCGALRRRGHPSAAGQARHDRAVAGVSRSDLDWEQAVMLDLYYVENWSLPLDLIIVMRTLKAVVTGRGAY